MAEAEESVRLVVERASKETGELWVADSDGIPVGFMLLESEGQKKSIEIDWLDVHPDYQRQGVGSVLLLKAEERARAHHCRFIIMHTASSNSRMREFGRANGFEVVDCIPHFWGAGTEDAYLLRKSLH